MALWIDQLCFGAIGMFSSHMTAYRAIDIIIFIVSCCNYKISAENSPPPPFPLDVNSLAGSWVVRSTTGKQEDDVRVLRDLDLPPWPVGVVVRQFSLEAYVCQLVRTDLGTDATSNLREVLCRTFFAIMSVVAAGLTVGVVIFGVICFRNFGEGLGNYCEFGFFFPSSLTPTITVCTSSEIRGRPNWRGL